MSGFPLGNLTVLYGSPRIHPRLLVGRLVDVGRDQEGYLRWSGRDVAQVTSEDAMFAVKRLFAPAGLEFRVEIIG